jgi:hypothetical protein
MTAKPNIFDGVSDLGTDDSLWMQRVLGDDKSVFARINKDTLDGTRLASVSSGFEILDITKAKDIFNNKDFIKSDKSNTNPQSDRNSLNETTSISLSTQKATYTPTFEQLSAICLRLITT